MLYLLIRKTYDHINNKMFNTKRIKKLVSLPRTIIVFYNYRDLQTLVARWNLNVFPLQKTTCHCLKYYICANLCFKYVSTSLYSECYSGQSSVFLLLSPGRVVSLTHSPLVIFGLLFSISEDYLNELPFTM